MRCVTTPGLWDYPSFHHLWWIGEVSHKKTQRFQISEVSPLKDDTVEPGQDYMTSMKLGPNVAQNTVGNLSFYVIFCEGFMDFFPAHPIASHRAVVQGICNFLKFLDPAQARSSAKCPFYRAILSDCRRHALMESRDHVGLRKS